MRRTLPCAASVVTALAIQALAGRALADRDVILALLTETGVGTVALIAAIVAARLFLFLLAPGWALHVAAKMALERWATKRGER